MRRRRWVPTVISEGRLLEVPTRMRSRRQRFDVRDKRMRLKSRLGRFCFLFVMLLEITKAQAQIQTTGDDIFAAYCFGVIEGHILRMKFWGPEFDKAVADTQSRSDRLRAYLTARGYFSNATSGNLESITLALEAGAEDIGQCYRTSAERGKACYGEAIAGTMGRLVDDQVYDRCQNRLRPEGCRRSAKCSDLSRFHM
jgi:hypothetical protein